MSIERKTEVIRKFCDIVQGKVTLTVTISEFLSGTPKQLITRNVLGIRCDHPNEDCPSECDLKSQITKAFTWRQ